MRSNRKVILQSCSAIALGAAIAGVVIPFRTAPSLAQQVNRIQQATELIYAELPDFPKENHYVSADGAEFGNTLVRRFLAYHVYVQGRPVQSRTDWKFTIADYLDLNEPMFADSYPSADKLTANPYKGDREVIQGLSRAERREFLAVIARVYELDTAFQALELANPLPSDSPEVGESVEAIPELREVVPEPVRPPVRGTAEQLL